MHVFVCFGINECSPCVAKHASNHGWPACQMTVAVCQKPRLGMFAPRSPSLTFPCIIFNHGLIFHFLFDENSHFSESVHRWTTAPFEFRTFPAPKKLPPTDLGDDSDNSDNNTTKHKRRRRRRRQQTTTNDKKRKGGPWRVLAAGAVAAVVASQRH